MTVAKFDVAFDPAQRTVHIYQEGDQTCPGMKRVGQFEADGLRDPNKDENDPEANYRDTGEHIYIRKAKEVLEELGVQDFQNMIYLDKASNAPTGDVYIPTLKEAEEAVKSGETVEGYASRVSENVEAADAEGDEAADKANAKKRAASKKSTAKKK